MSNIYLLFVFQFINKSHLLLKKKKKIVVVVTKDNKNKNATGKSV